MVPLQALIVAGFVLLHLSGGTLRFLDAMPRSGWLSTAGGISVAYVFVHIFPELQYAQRRIEEAGILIPWVEHHVYLVALAGLAVFYGLESSVKSAQSRRASDSDGEEDEPPTGGRVFWIHMLSFAAYNGLIGYLLVHREPQGLGGLLFFAFAMAVHFLVNDYALNQHHRTPYRRVGRWLLMGAIVIGWGVGLATDLSRAATDVLFAFLAGGIVLNVLKEELPEDRRSRFSAFALGAAGYTALLLLLQ